MCINLSCFVVCMMMDVFNQQSSVKMDLFQNVKMIFVQVVVYYVNFKNMMLLLVMVEVSVNVDEKYQCYQVVLVEFIQFLDNGNMDVYFVQLIQGM